jgi:hypothetical protein
MAFAVISSGFYFFAFIPNIIWYTKSGTDQPIQKSEGEISSNFPKPIHSRYFKVRPDTMKATVTI